jgi:hypothetical protein
MTLNEVISIWKDDPETHRLINDSFTQKVNENGELKAYRDFVEGNNDTPVKIFGFGERSFLWMWKLLVDEMPLDFKFLEIGVFRGQILGLIRLLSKYKWPSIIGITPLDSTGGHWESDYAADIKLLHETFRLKRPSIIKGLSTDPDIISAASRMYPGYNMVYIDGGHDYETASSDIKNFSPLVRVGGYLVIDDCANKYNLPNGYFRGIETVSRAVDELLPNEKFKEMFSVVHNRIFKRIG